MPSLILVSVVRLTTNYKVFSILISSQLWFHAVNVSLSLCVSGFPGAFSHTVCCEVVGGYVHGIVTVWFSCLLILCTSVMKRLQGCAHGIIPQSDTAVASSDVIGGRQIDSAQLNLNTINSLATMHSSCMQVQIFCCNYKQAECDYTEGCLPAALALLPPPSSPSSSPLPSEPPPMTGSVARDSGIKGILGLLSCECVVCGVCLHTCISCHIGQSTAKHKQETLCILWRKSPYLNLCHWW